MTRRMAWLANVTLAVGTLALAGVLGEVGLRWFAPQPMGVFHHDRNGLAMHWPGLVTYLPQFSQTVSFNSAWMRDREHPLEKPPGVFRVMVLGDSFMEGLQVPFESSFPSLLERELARTSGRPVEVVNASVSGWGTDDELRYLADYGVKYRPDLVLIAVCLHNDIEDNLRERWHTIRDGSLIEQPRAPASWLGYKVVELKGFIATRSHLYQLWRRAWHRRDMEDTGRQLNDHVAQLFREPMPEQIALGLKLTRLMLQGIQALSAQSGGRVALVLIPLRAQVSDSALAASAGGARPQRLVTAIADSLGIPVIDLLPAFRQWTAQQGGDLYLEEGHWNETGHRVAADTTAKVLGALGARR